MNNNKSSKMIWAGMALLILHFINLFLIMVYAPMENTMGLIQKIFYYHVPIAWAGFLAYFTTFIYSILYLIKKDAKFDRIAHAAAELGTVFFLLVMITGPIWARFSWGKYWIWEPRLTTSFVLFILFSGYLLLRRFGGYSDRIARFASVLGIIAFLDVPLVYFSMHWWAPEISAHPTNIGMQSEMKTTFFISLFLFSMLFIYLLLVRVRTANLEDEYEALRQKKQG